MADGGAQFTSNRQTTRRTGGDYNVVNSVSYVHPPSGLGLSQTGNEIRHFQGSGFLPICQSQAQGQGSFPLHGSSGRAFSIRDKASSSHYTGSYSESKAVNDTGLFRGQPASFSHTHRTPQTHSQRPTNFQDGFPNPSSQGSNFHSPHNLPPPHLLNEAGKPGRTNLFQSPPSFQGGQSPSNVVPHQGVPLSYGNIPGPRGFPASMPPPLHFGFAGSPTEPYVLGVIPNQVSPASFQTQAGFSNPLNMLQGVTGRQIAFPGQFVGTSPNLSSPQTQDLRQADEEWVKKFVEERKLAQEEDKQKREFKVCEAKGILQRWLKLLNELTVQRDHLIDLIKSGDVQWKREVEKATNLKKCLQQTQSKFSSTEVDYLRERLNKKKKKRECQKRRRQHKHTEKQEAEQRKLELQNQIDQWREQEIAKDQARLKAASMKLEAGGVLGDVLRKKAEASKALEVIQALRKLREFRKQEAELKGVYPRPTSELDKEFTGRTKDLEKLMAKQCQLYESEEKTLMVMLAEEEEEKKRKKREKKDTQHLAEAAASESSDPLREFYRYYTQAEKTLESLLHIRHGWDIYIAPDAIPWSNRIPDDFLSPTKPRSVAWAAFSEENR